MNFINSSRVKIVALAKALASALHCVSGLPTSNDSIFVIDQFYLEQVNQFAENSSFSKMKTTQFELREFCADCTAV